MAFLALSVGIALLLVANAADQGSFNVRMKQPNAEMYHQQNVQSGQFNYGYHVDTVNNQFQHKVKGPDDVTYGCYGYVDPTGRKHLVYYVADRMGYRVIFPNRSTKIFTERVMDSLNKLDGATKSNDYDEKVVAWNDLYLPDSCFRLDEILSAAASSTSQQVVSPAPLPQPTQYTIPTTSRSSPTRPTPRPISHSAQYQTSSQVTYGQQSTNVYGDGRGNQGYQENTEQPTAPWTGSLPDINPANINLDQFDIQTGYVDASNTGSASASGVQFTSSQAYLNVTQLLAQIEAVNSQVITLNMLLAGMANNPNGFGNANEGSCKQVVQLLQTQRTTPQLVYVPILIPYVEGQYNVNQPFGAATGERYQQHKPCHQCQG